MKKVLCIALSVSVVLAFVSVPVMAADKTSDSQVNQGTWIISKSSSSSSKSSSKSSSGTVNVKGYYRKDGTYVQPYTRSAPASKGAESDNSSSQQNTPTSQGTQTDNSEVIIGVVNEVKNKFGSVTEYFIQTDQGDYTIKGIKRLYADKQLGKKLEVTGKIVHMTKDKKVIYVKDWKVLE